MNSKAKTRIFLALTLLSLSGCALFPTRTVLVDGTQNIMRVGPGGADMRVYYFNAAGKMELSRTKVHIPEGYYLGPRHVQ